MTELTRGDLVRVKFDAHGRGREQLAIVLEIESPIHEKPPVIVQIVYNDGRTSLVWDLDLEKVAGQNE